MDTIDSAGLDAEDLEYARAEREGKRLNDLLCVDCPDPGLCGAEGECPREASC